MGEAKNDYRSLGIRVKLLNNDCKPFIHTYKLSSHSQSISEWGKVGHSVA